MIVKLIAHTPDPEMVCAAAAFTSWKKLSTAELFEQMNREEALKFLKKVIGFGHLSVTEHATFTFSLSEISRACTHQLVRHRVASYTQQSQRYVKFERGEIGYVVPPSIKGNARTAYESAMDMLAGEYKKLVESGVPVEDARYILPNAAHTNIVVSMNARELLHFFGLRCCLRAQWEIRELAEKMLAEAKKVAPVLFGDAWARCKELGYCPEGELSCGLYPPKEKALKEAKAGGVGGRMRRVSGGIVKAVR